MESDGDEAEREVARDSYIETERARAQRIIESVNDDVSRRLLNEYVRDLDREQMSFSIKGRRCQGGGT